MFIASVSVTNDSVINGYGCRSRFKFANGSSLGYESPLIAFPAFFSQRSMSCCAFCFRQPLPFKLLIERIVFGRKSPRIEGKIGLRFRECCHCKICICQDCNKMESVHLRVCPGNDQTRKQWFRRLEEIGFKVSESIVLAGLLFARFACTGESLEDVEFEYMRYVSLPTTPAFCEGWELVQSLIGKHIPFEDFRAVVSAFERTNLFLEVENETMLRDIEEGCLTADITVKLREVYESEGFPAMMMDEFNIPLPVVIGSGHYSTVARLNHSCDPNIEWRSVDGTNKLEFVALRDISEGEELFISYIDQTKSREDRNAELKSLYGFTCTCVRCR